MEGWIYSLYVLVNRKNLLTDKDRLIGLAGETRFEHATDGFGDRDSTVELFP